MMNSQTAEHINRIIKKGNSPVQQELGLKVNSVSKSNINITYNWSKVNSKSYLIEDLENSGININMLNLNEFKEHDKGYDISYYNRFTNNNYLMPNGETFKRTKLKNPIGKAKYLSPKNGGIKPYLTTYTHEWLLNNHEYVILTEGEKKAIKASQIGLPVIGLGGIWAWMEGKGDKNINKDLLPYVQNKKVIMIYDSDCNDNKNKTESFNQCASDFATALKEHDSILYRINLPKSGNRKIGLDDYLIDKLKINYNETDGLTWDDLEDIYWNRIFEISEYLDNNQILVNPNIQFWKYNKKNNSYTINNWKLIEFLEQKGFAKIYNYNTQSSTFVKIENNIVNEVSNENIKDFLTNWFRNNKPELLNIFAKCPYNYCGNDKLELLKNIDIKFDNDSENKCRIYYLNGYLEIDKDKIILNDYNKLEYFIWEKWIIKRNYVHNSDKGEFEQFLNNVTNKNKDRLKALGTAIGYLCHRYKNKALSKAVILNDEAMESESGGTGKGIIFQALNAVRNVQNIDCRNRNQDKFMLQSVDPSCNIIHFEDIEENYDFGKLFNVVTSDLEIENKGQNRLLIPFENAPKIGISTNFVLSGDNISNKRRKYEFELSNHYNEKVTPEQEFGHLLFDDWNNDQWNRFDTLIGSFIQSYLNNRLIEFKTINLEKKKMIKNTCDDFMVWIELDFTIKYDMPYPKKLLTEQFNKKYNRCDSTRTVSKWIKLWCDYKRIKYRDIIGKGFNHSSERQIVFLGYDLN